MTDKELANKYRTLENDLKSLQEQLRVRGYDFDQNNPKGTVFVRSIKETI